MKHLCFISCYVRSNTTFHDGLSVISSEKIISCTRVHFIVKPQLRKLIALLTLRCIFIITTVWRSSSMCWKHYFMTCEACHFMMLIISRRLAVISSSSGGFMSENLVLDLSMQFAIDIVNLCETLKGKSILTNQLLRSGTSISANIHEADYAQSRADFVNK